MALPHVRVNETSARLCHIYRAIDYFADASLIGADSSLPPYFHWHCYCCHRLLDANGSFLCACRQPVAARRLVDFVFVSFRQAATSQFIQIQKRNRKTTNK